MTIDGWDIVIVHSLKRDEECWKQNDEDKNWA